MRSKADKQKEEMIAAMAVAGVQREQGVVEAVKPLKKMWLYPWG